MRASPIAKHDLSTILSDELSAWESLLFSFEVELLFIDGEDDNALYMTAALMMSGMIRPMFPKSEELADEEVAL